MGSPGRRPILPWRVVGRARSQAAIHRVRSTVERIVGASVSLTAGGARLAALPAREIDDSRSAGTSGVRSTTQSVGTERITPAAHVLLWPRVTPEKVNRPEQLQQFPDSSVTRAASGNISGEVLHCPP